MEWRHQRAGTPRPNEPIPRPRLHARTGQAHMVSVAAESWLLPESWRAPVQQPAKSGSVREFLEPEKSLPRVRRQGELVTDQGTGRVLLLTTCNQLPTGYHRNLQGRV